MKQVICLLICFHIILFPVIGQIGTVTPAVIDSLNQSAKSDSISLLERIRIGERCLKLAESIEYQNGYFDALMNIGIAYLDLGNLKEALDHFKQANCMAIYLYNPELQARSAFFLGNVHNYLDNFEKAMSFFKESLELYKSVDNLRWQGILTNAIGVVLSRAGDRNAGLVEFKKALVIFEGNDLEKESATPINNIGEHYLQDGLPEQAIVYYHKSLELNEKYSMLRGQVISLLNLGLSHRKMDKYDQALDYFNESLVMAKQEQFLAEVYDIYKEIASTYEKMGISDKSLEYYQKYSILKDSFLGREQEAQIAELLIEFETEKQERALIETKKEIFELRQHQRFQRLLLVVSIIGLLAAVGLVFLFYSRNQVRQQLIESKLENKGLESKKLKEELAFKQKDLTNFALDIARKNEFSQKIHDGLNLIHSSSNVDFRKDKIKELLILTSNHLKVNDDIREFQMNVETVNQDFFNRLTEQFPELTSTDKQLCGLLRLNLSTKDIASIRNISPKSVEMSRYRLRKKLNLSAQDEMTSFLQQL